MEFGICINFATERGGAHFLDDQRKKVGPSYSKPEHSMIDYTLNRGKLLLLHVNWSRLEENIK